MSTPLATVVVTTHQRHSLLREALASVMAQTYQEIECVVVDDAGDPATRAIVKELDPSGRRLNWHDRAEVSPLKGGQPSRNVGFKLSRGELVMFLDDDDLLASDCVKGRVEALLAAPGFDACVGQCRGFLESPENPDGLWCAWDGIEDELMAFLASRLMWQTTGPLWRRSALERVGPWDESLPTGHDYEYHVRALAKGIRFTRRDVVDYYWRAPRSDSYSGFERMKEQYRNGWHGLAFARGLAAINENNAWTEDRMHAAWHAAVRVGLLCRLYGGSRSSALLSIEAAYQSGCVSTVGYSEVKAAISAWFKVNGKIPALSYLARRGYRSTAL